MADRLLFVSWGATVSGREERALEVFNSAIAFYGRCQGDGRLESFDVVLLGPSGAGIHGFATLHGSPRATGRRCARTGEFRRVIADALLIVDDLAVVDGYANQGVAEQVVIYQEAIAGMPQLA